MSNRCANAAHEVDFGTENNKQDEREGKKNDAIPISESGVLPSAAGTDGRQVAAAAAKDSSQLFTISVTV